MTIKVLLQTTIAPAADDWSIDRFSLLAALLRQEVDESGRRRFDVTTGDRDPIGARIGFSPILIAATTVNWTSDGVIRSVNPMLPKALGRF